MTVTISGLDTAIDGLKKSVYQALPIKMRISQTIFGRKLLDKVRNNSPVGKTGSFQKAWTIDFSRNFCRISNSSPQAVAIEIGSEAGERPWPTIGTDSRTGKSKPTGRTIMSQGKIWSTQAIGGVLDRSMPEVDVVDMANELADNVIQSVVNAK